MLIIKKATVKNIVMPRQSSRHDTDGLRYVTTTDTFNVANI